MKTPPKTRPTNPPFNEQNPPPVNLETALRFDKAKDALGTCLFVYLGIVLVLLRIYHANDYHHHPEQYIGSFLQYFIIVFVPFLFFHFWADGQITRLERPIQLISYEQPIEIRLKNNSPYLVNLLIQLPKADETLTSRERFRVAATMALAPLFIQRQEPPSFPQIDAALEKPFIPLYKEFALKYLKFRTISVTPAPVTASLGSPQDSSQKEQDIWT
jgi:hypothetical protein